MPPPRTLLSTSRTRAINIPLALAGEAAQPHTAEEVVVEEVAAVVRDSVRGAWDVWMMFVDRSARAVNKRTAKAIKSLLKCRHKGENTLVD